MATTPSPDPAPPSKQEDWDHTMADVKRLVEALHSLMPSTSPANHEPKPQPESKIKPVSCSKHNVFTYDVHIWIDTA